jgi:hypothetical protein
MTRCVPRHERIAKVSARFVDDRCLFGDESLSAVAGYRTMNRFAPRRTRLVLRPERNERGGSRRVYRCDNALRIHNLGGIGAESDAFELPPRRIIAAGRTLMAARCDVGCVVPILK